MHIKHVIELNISILVDCVKHLSCLGLTWCDSALFISMKLLNVIEDWIKVHILDALGYNCMFDIFDHQCHIEYILTLLMRYDSVHIKDLNIKL